MARPWKKKSAWPYVAKSGRKSYTLGFYDHEKVERSRTFPSVRHARGWMDGYITAERSITLRSVTARTQQIVILLALPCPRLSPTSPRIARRYWIFQWAVQESNLQPWA